MSAGAAVIAPRATVPTRALAGAWLLSFSTALSGLLAYAFHVLAARSLGAADYGRIAVLWAALFLIVVVLFRPLEQTTSRAVAERRARGAESQSVLRAVLALYLLLVAGFGAIAVGGWSFVTDRLFVGDDALTAALVAGVTGYGLAYVLRGLLSGSGWFEGYGALLLGDAGIRLLAAVPLVAVASSDVAAAAVAAAGIGGAVVPLVVGARKLRNATRGAATDSFRLTRALGFAAPATAVAAADQVLVNGGPILVMVGGGSPETAGLVFAATMLVRVPVYLFQGVAASLLPNLTRMSTSEDVAAFRRGVARPAAVLFALGLTAIAGAAAAGPQALQLVYGAEFDAGRLELTLLGCGVAFYLLAATVSQALLALEAVRSAAVAWCAGAFAFLTVYAVVDGGELLRTSAALAAATALSAVLLVLLLARQLKR
jgi:O-antigen/teichoic acid export membrane protein